MVNFITYVSGNIKWLHLQSTLPEVALPTQEIDTLRHILGTSSLENCIKLYRLCSSFPFIRANLPKETIELDFAGLMQAVSGTTAQLISTGRDLPSSLPTNFNTVAATPIVLKYKSDTTAEISIDMRHAILPVSYSNEVLHVQWPQEWNIKGNLRLPEHTTWSPGTMVELPVRYSYPVQEIDKVLRQQEYLYDQLQNTNLVAEFYSADSAAERVAIVVLALIRLVSK